MIISFRAASSFAKSGGQSGAPPRRGQAHAGLFSQCLALNKFKHEE